MKKIMMESNFLRGDAMDQQSGVLSSVAAKHFYWIKTEIRCLFHVFFDDANITGSIIKSFEILMRMIHQFI